MDELWSFLRNKNNQLWVFVGFDAGSRFWMNFELGSRTTHTATKLVKQIKHYLGILAQANPLKIATNKLAAYNNALQSVFTDIDDVYLQIVKKRIKMRLITVKKCFVKGTEADFTDTLWINLYNYNYRCHHKSLKLPLTHPGTSKFQKNWSHRTPAWQWN
ncbi:MAG: IS1 family transposase [Methylococcales bacterium]|nr:IS1 family transposase [Methylococcales bacterium]